MNKISIYSVIIIWTLISMVISGPLAAQQVYKKLYPAVGFSANYWAIEKGKLHYSYIDSTIYYVEKNTVLKISLIGNLLQNIHVHESLPGGAAALYPEIINNKLAINLTEWQDASRRKVLLYDLGTNTKQVLGFQLPFTDSRPNISKYYGNTFTIQGLLQPIASTPYPYIALIDSNGGIEWQAAYPNAFASFKGTCHFPGRKMMAFGNLWFDGPLVTMFDSLGSAIWARTYSLPIGEATQFLSIGDSSAILIGLLRNDSLGSNTGKLYIMNIDSSGKVKWCHLLGNKLIAHYNNNHLPGNESIKMTKDGGCILLLNFVTSKLQPPVSGGYQTLIKMDKYGTINWVRFHGEKGVPIYISDVLELEDGSFFTIASAGSSTWRGYYAMRTDSLGFAGCQEYTDTLPVIYNFPVTDSLIQLITAPAGITTYTATAPDTLLPLPLPANGCMLSGVPEAIPGRQAALLLYPNPATGKVTVQLPAGQLPEELVVTDAMGRTVRFMRPAPGTQIEIDLTGLPPGLLLVRVITQQGALSARLVKQ